MERHRARIDGLDTHWIAAGPSEAPVVVLLHGGGIDRATRSWAEILPELSQDYRVYAPDLPGYGDSESAPGKAGIAELGPWASAFVEEVSKTPVHLVGNSMGGGLGLWLALNRPDQIASLVPVGSHGLASRAPLHPLFHLVSQIQAGRVLPWAISRHRWAAWGALAFLFADPSRITPKLVEEMRTEAKVQARRHAFRAFIAREAEFTGFRFYVLPRVHQIEVSVTFVHGTKDRLVPASASESAAQRAPNGTFAPMEAGHWPMREQPEAFLAVLRDHLNGADR